MQQRYFFQGGFGRNCCLINSLGRGWEKSNEGEEVKKEGGEKIGRNLWREQVEEYERLIKMQKGSEEERRGKEGE